MVRRRNRERGCIEPALRGAVAQLRIAQQVRAVGAENAAGVPRVAVVEAQNRCERLAGLRGRDAAKLEPTPRIQIRGHESIRDIEAGDGALGSVIPAVLREILVGRGSQER